MSTYFTFTPYEPGDSVAGLDTVIQSVETSLNDLPAEAMADRCLGRQHFSTSAGLIDNVKGGAISQYSLSHYGSTHDYVAGTETIDYNAYGDDGTTDRNVVGDTTDAGYTGGTAQITGLGIAPAIGSTRDHRPVLWVKGNVQVRNADAAIEQVMVAVQIQDDPTVGSTVWRTVDRTERFVSIADHKISSEVINIDVPIKAIITVGDLAAVANTLDGVRLVVAGYAAGGLTGGDTLTLNRWNFTAVPLRWQEG